MPSKPQLSVVIASFNASRTIAACLESLENQKTDKSFEIIVVDSSTDGTAELVEKGFPEVRLYRFPERKFCGDARNWGISVARGGIIAFIDADCTADSNWVDEILKAHRSPYLAIGGAIANGGSSSVVGWAAYFCEFSQWMPNTSATWLDDVAGANMSYKREIFDEFGPFIEGTYCSDTEFHWRLGRMGHRLRFVSSILISHHGIDDFSRFVRHEYYHGRDFARVRVRGQNFSVLRRSLYATLFFLIPAKLFLEIGLSNFKNRIYLSAFLKASPLLILGLASWSLGEFIGYFGGQTNEKSSELCRC
jgi:glycosyltransferase involved in cell wall biosynthesis